MRFVMKRQKHLAGQQASSFPGGVMFYFLGERVETSFEHLFPSFKCWNVFGVVFPASGSDAPWADLSEQNLALSEPADLKPPEAHTPQIRPSAH